MDNNSGQFGGQSNESNNGQFNGQNNGQFNGSYNGQYGGQFGEQPEKPLSMGEWLVSLIILAIPCVGLVMLFVWGFGQGNISRRNYCRAALIIKAILLVLIIIIYAAAGAMVLGSLNSLSRY